MDIDRLKANRKIRGWLWSLAFIPILAVGIWLYFNNRHFRQDNEALLKQNKKLAELFDRLHRSNDSLNTIVDAERTKIEIQIADYDSLKSIHEKLLTQRIIVTNEKYSTVTYLDDNGQLRVFTEWLAKADSSGH